ncbi:MAG: hypothetical protein RIM72_20060 [Alphaproteobacteria bacterium]
MLDDDNPSDDQPGYRQYATLYTSEFLEELADRFDFDVSNSLTLSRLYEIPYRYNLANRIADGGEGIKLMRRKYEKLEKAFLAFQQELEKFGDWGIDSELWRGAKLLPMFDPKLESERYPEFIYKSSIAYCYEFLPTWIALRNRAAKSAGRETEK